MMAVPGHVDVASAKALGWAGSVTRVRVLGISVVCAYTVCWPTHLDRVAAGRPPCPDPGQLHCLFGDDEWLTDKPVLLQGLLVSGRSWRTGAADAAALTAFAPVAVRLPGRRCTREVMLEADLSGIGLLAANPDGTPRLVVPPGPYERPPHTRMQTVMTELVYDAAWAALQANPAA
jgi:hypothetical protein